MDAPVAKPPLAWQPLTPHGVAAFAFASFGRLLLVQFIVALGVAGAVVWFLQTAWFPVVASAIRRLPETGEVRSGRFQWRGESPMILADNHFLALTVDLEHSGEARSPAHLQVEFGSSNLRVFSLFGFYQAAYPRTWVIAINRSGLVPWWGAWAPEILALAAGVVVAALLVIWWGLSAIYASPLWVAGFFANRDLSLAGAWRLAGAALMPGAVFQIGVLIFYGLGGLDLVKLISASAIHLIIGWGYLLAALACLPRSPGIAPAGMNPFHAAHPADSATAAGENSEPPRTPPSEKP